MVSLDTHDATLSSRRARAPIRPDRQDFGVLGAILTLTVPVLPMVGASFALLLMSPVLLLAGLSVALSAWRRHAPWNSRGVTRWDVAGLLMLLGFTAALLSDPVRSLP